MATDSRLKSENGRSLGEKKKNKVKTAWNALYVSRPLAAKSDILFPTVIYLYIPTAWGREGKYTDAESIRPHNTTARNTLRVEYYLIFVGGRHGCSEMLRTAPRITPVFAFRV